MKRIASYIVGLFAVLLPVQAQMGHFYFSERFTSGLVNKVCQDQYGYIWVGTEYGLNRFDGYRFTPFLHHQNDPGSLGNNDISSMFCDSEGRLWVGTAKGLDRYDYTTGQFVHYPFEGNVSPRVSCITQCDKGQLFVATAGYGLFKLQDEQLAYVEDGYTTPGQERFYNQFMCDGQGRFWKSGFGDVVTMREPDGNVIEMKSAQGNVITIIERNDEMLVVSLHGISVYADGVLKPAPFDMSALGSNIILASAFRDHVGDIYIGTRGEGLFRLPKNSLKVERVECIAWGIDLNTAKIWDINEDRNGNLWIACYSKGLVHLRHIPPQFRTMSFSAQGVDIGSTVSSVCEGDGGMIWVTVQGNGIYGFNRQGRIVAKPVCPPNPEFIFRDKQKRYWVGTGDALYAYDPATGRSQKQVTFDCDKFNDMTSDDTGNIYISTYSRGFCIYNPKTGELRNFRSADRDSLRGHICNDWVLAMLPDQEGRIWLATSDGLSCYDPKTDSFLSQGWLQQLTHVKCNSLCATSRGEILIGTDEGLYVYKDSAEPQLVEAMSDKVIGYIVEADNGDIWCSTPMGLWQYDVSKNTYVSHVNGNGLITREYVNCVGLHTDDDFIYFATNDGLVGFRPSNVVSSRTELKDVQLTGFTIAGHESRPVIGSDRFKVSYMETDLTLEFSLLDFNNPRSVAYEYCVGSGSWVRNPQGINVIQLSHLQPGEYPIQVRARAGDLCSATKTITIEVTPPWYRTTLAYFLYLLALIALVGFMAYSYRRRANRQMDEEKMKFLINATHDIRSPLTIILSALKKIKAERLRVGNDQSGMGNPAVDTIEHNAQRILNLVNQILDVRKIDKQQMQLHCQQTDIVAFTEGVCRMFDFPAKERNIHFTFDHEGLDHLDAWIDRTQFDKVISNLLSNAFKYCNDGGEVVVGLKSLEDSLELSVSDNGVGIDEDSLKHIFDRFYQGSNSRRIHIDGTGIGLNLCKMIVAMHHGTIEAHNRTDTNGAVFTVRLPLGKDHLKPEELESQTEIVQLSRAKTSSSKYRVLIVDDDLEMARYVSSELGRYYKFGICPNGKEGLKELLTNEYDVVVSDVMMPEMDGFTMLRMVKTNINISHIPVIMLTSKADVANRLEGLERGADAFLAKPFDMEELHMVIENLVQSRLRLKGKYSGAQQAQADKVDQPEVRGNDEVLMERIMKCINKNISDSDFNVERLTQEVGISRVQLHRKMKELTGISTSEFIRNIRLEQAARLLKEQKINVTQVAYTVGFSNLAHFSTIFRKHFGVAPSEYAEREAGV
ncbi:MAG: helix-turn-helix domain-containing protein [Prevotella sp.]|nr:helix-turn-helix domain-containing protein [Prevotella sp.]